MGDYLERSKTNLNTNVDEAKKEGLSSEGVIKLLHFLAKKEGVFRIKPRSGDPAKVSPVSIKRDPSKKACKSKDEEIFS